LGYKQLLNFGAYSIPDIGGWMLTAAGLLLFIAVAKEARFLNRFKKTPVDAALVLLVSMSLISCSAKEPKPIKLNVDNCEFCKMTVSNGKFASELITQKGRYYIFDDVSCMIKYVKANSGLVNAKMYVNDYLDENKFIAVEKGFYLMGGTINAPMGGKVAAFVTNENTTAYQTKLSAQKATWSAIYNTY